MGLFGDLVGRVVMKYEADTKQAREAVRGLSTEQKKAAKEQADALDKQTEKVKAWAGEWVKGAAIIGGTLLVAQNSLAKYRDETRLAAGAAGVDIGRLSDAYDGLRTRTELMTLAQAGHQGAWKLTTGQIELVVDGMRALEAKGYDSQKVFERFTEILRKGKTEGIDEFGISLKDTGDKTTDLRQLMRELGRQVVDVGGNFDRAGDDAQRALVRMEDGLARVRKMAGSATSSILGLAAAAGTGLGRLVYGELPVAGGNELAPSQYARALQIARGGLTQQGRDFSFGYTNRVFANPSNKDVTDAKAIDAFRQNLRRLRTVDELDKALAKLPSDWKSVDANLIDRVDRYRQEIARKTIDEMATGMKSALTLAVTKGGVKPSPRRSGGRGARGEAVAGDTFLDEAIGYGSDFYAFAMGEAERAAAASRGRLGLDMIETQSTGRGILSMLGDDETRASLAKLQEELAGAAAKSDTEFGGKSWLEKMFGPVDQIDAYDEAFLALGSTVQGVSAGMFKAWSEGGKLTMATLRELAAGEIALEGQKLWARGTSGILTGAFNLAFGRPEGAGQIAAGSAMLAGAAAIGALARTIGGSSSTPSTSTPGGGRSSAGGRGGDASGDRGGDRTVVVMTSAVMEASERQRERQTYRALTRRGSVYLPPGRN